MRIAPAFMLDVPTVVAGDALRHTWASYSKTLNQIIFQAHTEAWLWSTTKPMLIVQGTKDTVALLDNVQRTIDYLPSVRLLPLGAGNRLIFIDSRSVAQALVDFLQEPRSPAP
jgi:pimeloyl-ACP methyl ester carboxylesterase